MNAKITQTECFSPYRRAAGAALLILCAAASGCQQLGWTKPSPLGPVADRLRAAYPDLQGGKFIIIADFEQPEQQYLFRTEPGPPPPRVSTRRSRPETGAGALHFVLPSTKDRLIADNTQALGWHLPSDWRGYWVLLMSVYAEEPCNRFAFGVKSGRTQPRRFELAGLTLKTGWNLLRIDLAEVGASVDMSDIQQLTWWCADMAEPAKFYLDDIILADNAQNLLASPEAPAGSMFVQRRGRHLRVGVTGRFELVFSRGRLSQWYALGGYPQGRRQLAGSDGIGPHLLALSQPNEGAPIDLARSTDWSALGPVVQAESRLVAVNEERVVLEGRWIYGGAAPSSDSYDTQSGTTRQQRCVYTVTRQGRIYMQMDSALQHGEWRPDDVGFAISLDPAAGFETLLPPAEQSPDRTSPSFALHARTEARSADLLLVMHRPDHAPKHRQLLNGQNRVAGSVAFGGRPAGAQARWAMMLVLWPPDIDSLAEALPIAADYCTGPAPEVAVGRLVRDVLGDFDNDGFNESAGYYTVALDGNVARFVIDGRDQLRFYPTFKVRGTAGKRCWAYADGKLVTHTWLGPDGVLFMQIDRVLDKAVTVEVVANDGSAS
jgi:hypothetical protein